MEIVTHTGAEIAPLIPLLSRLRVRVFREWPYLYEGDETAEAEYLGDFAGSQDALLVTAEDRGEVIGVSTGSALESHHGEFAAPLRAAGIDTATSFYFAESVLLPEYRGHGIGHRFFDARESFARYRGYTRACFCAVVRPADHPLRPDAPRVLEAFWEGRGYRKVEGAIAKFSWRDVGETEETPKPLQFYMAAL